MTLRTAAIVRTQEGYQIREAGLRDLRDIRRLEQLIFPQDSYSYTDLLLLLLIPGMHNLKLVDDNGALIGFVSGGRLMGAGRAWIMTIGVHPDHQRRGLGRMLLERCEALLPYAEVYLTVRQTNLRAMRIYQKAGYRLVRVKEAYYPDGEAGIEMVKQLLV